MDASTRLALPSLSQAESRTTPEPPSAQQLSDAGWRPGHGFALAPHEAGFDRQLGRHVEPADNWPTHDRSAGSADASDQGLPRCLARCQAIATDALLQSAVERAVHCINLDQALVRDGALAAGLGR